MATEMSPSAKGPEINICCMNEQRRQTSELERENRTNKQTNKRTNERMSERRSTLNWIGYLLKAGPRNAPMTALAGLILLAPALLGLFHRLIIVLVAFYSHFVTFFSSSSLFSSSLLLLRSHPSPTRRPT